MIDNRFSASELILNPDGSVYHLGLLPQDIANTIITVGDPERVSRVSSRFEMIDVKKSKREFTTHTGWYKNHHITVISTGMGTDNIDIALHELDILANIDCTKKCELENKKSLNIIRIGTSGALHKEIEVDSFLVSQYALGLEGLLNFYTLEHTKEEQEILASIPNLNIGIEPHVVTCYEPWLGSLPDHLKRGTTITCPGFYGPQQRYLRSKPKLNVLDQLQNITTPFGRFTNIEMETAGIYGLSKLLGHRAISLNAILANRETGRFSSKPKQLVNDLIDMTLSWIDEFLSDE